MPPLSDERGGGCIVVAACATCDVALVEPHGHGDVLTDVSRDARARALAERRVRELPERLGRARPKLICPTCIVEICALGAAEATR